MGVRIFWRGSSVGKDAAAWKNNASSNVNLTAESKGIATMEDVGALHWGVCWVAWFMFLAVALIQQDSTQHRHREFYEPCILYALPRCAIL